MEKVDENIYYPKAAGKEISFMLYNYENIDKLIDNRKITLMDSIDVRNSAWLKSRKADGYTLEDVISRFDDDNNIKRLKTWKKVINSFISKLYDNPNKIYYLFIKYKFLEKLDNEIIAERLNLEEKDIKSFEVNIKWLLYCYAINSELFIEEGYVKCQNVK